MKCPNLHTKLEFDVDSRPMPAMRQGYIRQPMLRRVFSRNQCPIDPLRRRCFRALVALSCIACTLACLNWSKSVWFVCVHKQKSIHSIQLTINLESRRNERKRHSENVIIYFKLIISELDEFQVTILLPNVQQNYYLVNRYDVVSMTSKF